MSLPHTVENWLELAQEKEEAARVLLEHGGPPRQCWKHCGECVEYLLKARIMRVERLNAWPSPDSRKDLYIHDLRRLSKLAKIKLEDLPPPTYASFLKAFEWRREHDYIAGKFSAKAGTDMFSAVFDEPDGVAVWLKSNT